MNADEIIKKINRSIIDEAEIRRVSEILYGGFLAKPDGGPAVCVFQEFMASLLDKKYAFAVSSGTAALHLAVAALELRPGDEVIVPALANIADCSVVLQEGAEPIFVDIDP